MHGAGSRALRRWLTLAAVVVSPAGAAAQDSSCTFEACALTVRTNPMGTTVYQGPDHRHVATLGLFPGALEAFRNAADSSAYYHGRFRHHYNLGSALSVAALVGATVGSIFALTENNSQIPIMVGTAVLSIGFSFAGSNQFSVGRRHLERSVMWHNRALLGADRRIDRPRP